MDGGMNSYTNEEIITSGTCDHGLGTEERDYFSAAQSEKGRSESN